jgi:hypothetical protein
MMLAHEFKEFRKIQRTGFSFEMRQNLGPNFVSTSHRDLAFLAFRQTACHKTVLYESMQLMAARSALNEPDRERQRSVITVL